MKILSILLLSVTAWSQTTVAPNTTTAPGSTLAKYGGPVFVASTGQALGTNGGTTTAINTTGANFLAACVTHTAATTTTPTDSAGNSWPAPFRTDVASGINQNDFYYISNPLTSASETFTLTGTGSKSGIMVQAFSNMASNPLDQQNGNNSTGNNTTFGPGTVIPTTNNEVIIPCISTFINPSAPGYAITGFGGVVQYGYAAAHYSGGQLFQLQGAAASVTPVFTWGGSTASAQAASDATFISLGSAIGNCSTCTYSTTTSTNSGGTSVANDPTSLRAAAPTGALVISLFWHNGGGPGTQTVTGGTVDFWRRCSDGTVNPSPEYEISANVYMGCLYAFATKSNAVGITTQSTTCSTSCPLLGGIYPVFTGVFIPQSLDFFATNTLAISSSGANNLSLSSSPVTPSQTGDLIVGYCNVGSGASVSGSPAGTSPIAFSQDTTNANNNGSMEYAIYNSTSPVTPTMNGSNGVAYGCMVIGFK